MYVVYIYKHTYAESINVAYMYIFLPSHAFLACFYIEYKNTNLYVVPHTIDCVLLHQLPSIKTVKN